MSCCTCFESHWSSSVEIDGQSSLVKSEAYHLSPSPSKDRKDDSMVLAYCVKDDEELPRRRVKGGEELPRGPAVHFGTVLRLVGSTLQVVTLTLRSNGFVVKVIANKAYESRLLSPFTSVTKCDVADLGLCGTLQPDAAFKLTTVKIRPGCQDSVVHCFAAVGQSASEDCDQWMRKFGDAVKNVTRSLFPRGQVMVQPLAEAPCTQRRLLAGYLLQCDSGDTVSVPYVELQGNLRSKALFVAYSNSRCHKELWRCELSEHLKVFVWEGLGRMFKVDERFFCARTEDEKMLWVRALSNMKVKLLVNAPEPTSRQFESFRKAVQERVKQMRDEDEDVLEHPKQMRDQNEDEAEMDPLLPACTAAAVPSTLTEALPPLMEEKREVMLPVLSPCAEPWHIWQVAPLASTESTNPTMTSRAEWIIALFKAYDRDRDGFLNSDELKKFEGYEDDAIQKPGYQHEPRGEEYVVSNRRKLDWEQHYQNCCAENGIDPSFGFSLELLVELINNKWPQGCYGDLCVESRLMELGLKAVRPLSEEERKAFLNKLQTFVEANDSHMIPFIVAKAPLVVKNDKVCMLSVVTDNGKLLQYAADPLKSDKDVVLAAIKSDGMALRFVNKKADMWQDKDFVLHMVQACSFHLKITSGSQSESWAR